MQQQKPDALYKTDYVENAICAATFRMLVDILLDLDFNLNELCGKTDEELAAIAKNNKSAAAVLMSRYSKLVFIKSGIYANYDTDSDDLQQEGLLSLMRAIASFNPERGVKFSTFAEVCIENRMRTVIRRSKDLPLNRESLEDAKQSDALSVTETPESIYLYKEFISELWSGISSVLSTAELKTFNLCMQGISYKSAAEMLGTTEKSIDNAMQRARRKIRTLIIKLKMTG